MRHWLNYLLFLVLVGAPGVAVSAPIPDAEALKPPTQQRLVAILAAAQREGWAAQTEPLRAAAEKAYRHEQLPAAEAWFNLYRWTGLWGMNDNEYITRWSAAVKSAGVGHANMAKNYPLRGLPLGFLLLPELQLWLLGNDEFSREFFALLTPVDYLPAVFQILNELHFDNAAKFKTYAKLATAIALVYDVPPPPHWPHGQVTQAALARKWPKPLDAFTWWTKQDELGRTFHRLTSLGAEELKFVVDASAPFAELEWSQQVADYPLNSLGKAYTMVRYDYDRVQRDDLNWRGESYALNDILAAGGICVDQAYFATNVGKARGVPTLLFRGQGVSSRHAWFGFLDAKDKWQFDVGRYAEQRFVTGYTIDPQTWREISDHELRFLADRFLTQPAYLQSRIHAMFAADFLGRKNAVAAGSAAQKAAKLEPRNFPAWEIMVSAEKALNLDARVVEQTLREAAEALRNYPDLEAGYSARASESLRARGELAAADEERNRITLKNRDNRGDIALRRARDTLVKSFASEPLPTQVGAFEALVAAQGKEAGIAFFDQVILVFVEHLLQLQQPDEALKAVETARKSLLAEGNSQLSRDFDRLVQRIKSGP
jgi:hypothetical protein